MVGGAPEADSERQSRLYKDGNGRGEKVIDEVNGIIWTTDEEGTSRSYDKDGKLRYERPR